MYSSLKGKRLAIKERFREMGQIRVFNDLNLSKIIA